jgi:K+-transporting ATPase ATPase C chain
MAILKQSMLMLLAMTLLTGLVYPLVITTIAQLAFPHQSNGSLIKDDSGKVVGSELIGQEFKDVKYFWSRPSATGPFPYNSGASSGSNLGPTNEALLKAIAERITVLRSGGGDQSVSIPADLVTSSASGLDPHISPAAAEYQVERVAKARGVDAKVVRQVIEKHTQGRQLGFLGEPVVNVLLINLELDRKVL